MYDKITDYTIIKIINTLNRICLFILSFRNKIQSKEKINYNNNIDINNDKDKKKLINNQKNGNNITNNYTFSAGVGIIDNDMTAPLLINKEALLYSMATTAASMLHCVFVSFYIDSFIRSNGILEVFTNGGNRGSDNGNKDDGDGGGSVKGRMLIYFFVIAQVIYAVWNASNDLLFGWWADNDVYVYKEENTVKENSFWSRSKGLVVHYYYYYLHRPLQRFLDILLHRYSHFSAKCSNWLRLDYFYRYWCYFFYYKYFYNGVYYYGFYTPAMYLTNKLVRGDEENGARAEDGRDINDNDGKSISSDNSLNISNKNKIFNRRRRLSRITRGGPMWCASFVILWIPIYSSIGDKYSNNRGSSNKHSISNDAAVAIELCIKLILYDGASSYTMSAVRALLADISVNDNHKDVDKENGISSRSDNTRASCTMYTAIGQLVTNALGVAIAAYLYNSSDKSLIKFQLFCILWAAAACVGFLLSSNNNSISDKSSIKEVVLLLDSKDLDDNKCGKNDNNNNDNSNAVYNSSRGEGVDNNIDNYNSGNSDNILKDNNSHDVNDGEMSFLTFMKEIFYVVDENGGNVPAIVTSFPAHPLTYSSSSSLASFSPLREVNSDGSNKNEFPSPSIKDKALDNGETSSYLSFILYRVKKRCRNDICAMMVMLLQQEYSCSFVTNFFSLFLAAVALDAAATVEGDAVIPTVIADSGNLGSLNNREFGKNNVVKDALAFINNSSVIINNGSIRQGLPFNNNNSLSDPGSDLLTKSSAPVLLLLLYKLLLSPTSRSLVLLPMSFLLPHFCVIFITNHISNGGEGEKEKKYEGDSNKNYTKGLYSLKNVMTYLLCIRLSIGVLMLLLFCIIKNFTSYYSYPFYRYCTCLGYCIYALLLLSLRVSTECMCKTLPLAVADVIDEHTVVHRGQRRRGNNTNRANSGFISNKREGNSRSNLIANFRENGKSSNSDSNNSSGNNNSSSSSMAGSISGLLTLISRPAQSAAPVICVTFIHYYCSTNANNDKGNAESYGVIVGDNSLVSNNGKNYNKTSISSLSSSFYPYSLTNTVAISIVLLTGITAVITAATALFIWHKCYSLEGEWLREIRGEMSRRKETGDEAIK